MAPSAKTIRLIVQLRQMLRRWRARASSRRSSSSSPPPSPAPPPSDVPAGHLAVCVGSSNKRYVVRATYLNHPVFRTLLVRAEEEYGFSSPPGPLAIPCDETVFEEILRYLGGPKSSSSSIASLEDFIMQVGGGGSCRAEGLRGESRPLPSGGGDCRTSIA